MKPWILGHRGYSSKFIENTLEAFEGAEEAKADGIELDVWLSKDKKIVVFHDDSLYRLFHNKTKIKEMTYKDLLKFSFENGAKIPLLDDVLKILPKSFILNVEIKDYEVVPFVIDLLKEYRSKRNTIVSSFNRDALKEVHGFKRGLLVDKNVFIENDELRGIYTVHVPIETLKIDDNGKFLKIKRPLIIWAENDSLIYDIDLLKKYIKKIKGIISNDILKAKETIKMVKGK